MINVSNLFKEELNNGNRNYMAYVRCSLKNGTVLNLENRNIWASGFEIERNVSAPNSFEIGSAIINKATIVLNNIYDDFSGYDFLDARMFLQIGLKLSNGTIEKIDLGYFDVNEPKYNGSLITLEGLDDIAKFDKPYSLSDLVYPATLLEIVQDACAKCNVLCGIAAFDNSDYVVQERPNDKALTFRQILSWVGQISCVWFEMNRLGKLDCGWYDLESYSQLNIISGGILGDGVSDIISGGQFDDNTQDIISGERIENTAKYHLIDSLNSIEAATDDLIVTGLKVDEISSEQSGKTNTFMVGTEGYVIHLKGNKLIQSGQAEVVANQIQKKVVGLRFRPIKVTFQSDPTIEAGDIALISDRKGNIYRTLITGNRFEVGNTQSIECGAKFSIRNGASRFSKSDQDIADMEDKIEVEKTEREKAIAELTETMSNNTGIHTTIETTPSGGKVYYLHDKPKLGESMIVWKMTADAWAVSTDGGKTWNGGMTVDGDMITRILQTIGVNADWIKTGTLNANLIKAGILSDRTGNNYWNLDTGDFQLTGMATTDGVQDMVNQAQQNAIQESAKSLLEYANTVSKDFETMQKQVDGQVEDWYYDYEPTPNNVPASTWTTEKDKQKHEGDRFFWKSKGYAYRWMRDGSTWKWVLLKDTDITKAMQTAAEAKDAADSKRRTFITQPVPPYDVGDLWMDGTDVLTCMTSRLAGSYFSKTDWKKLNTYTDDTVANEALGNSQNPNHFLTQQQVFNKLTNNGVMKGIFMRDGELFINATYLSTGILTDSSGKNSWNLETGEIRLERLDLQIENQDSALKEVRVLIDKNAESINASVQRVEENTNKAIDAANRDIRDLTSKASQTMTADQIRFEIQKEREKGAEKVVTTTGVTVNEDGITVDKTGSPIKTQITEDGMGVYKNGNKVLTANNQGVDAENLHATTYLIIGNNSRVEDYGSDRTACFWIGD